MKTRMNQSRRLMAGVIVAGMAAGACGQTFDVSDRVSFAPFRAPTPAPYSNFTAAFCADVTNLAFEDGLYPEAGVINHVGVFSGPTTGSAVLGVTGANRTDFKILTWNLHLFGSLPFPVWQDEARARSIGDALRDLDSRETLDFIALQEVWAGTEADMVFEHSGMQFSNRVSTIEPGGALGSGLMGLRDVPSTGFLQEFYDAERGEDAGASKGFTQQTIYKAGIAIGVFNTHTQSGGGSDNADTRFSQLMQLASAIFEYRVTYPDRPVFVAGDFNISTSSDEFDATLRTMSILATVGETSVLGETGYNLDNACIPDITRCTSCNDNPVHSLFYGSGGDGRIDFIFYCHSRDGSVRVLPKDYAHLRPLAASTISGDAYAPGQCNYCNFSSRVLSDHDAIMGTFEIVQMN